MQIPQFNPLASTKKELLGNDINVLAHFLKADHEYINEELITKAKEELKRLYEMYKEEEK